MAAADEDMKFGRFRIPASHIFYRSNLTAAFVNLRPIVPGHVLVVPRRVVPLLVDLAADEYEDLWASVRKVQALLSKHYTAAAAYNVAVQDGAEAGQSVPHVHVHVLPRVAGDFERNDMVYDELEEWAPRREMAEGKPKLVVPDDSNRKDRTVEEMTEEAATYRSYL